MVAAGALAGVLAALTMIAFMAASAALDGDALDPLRAVGTTFRGPEALEGGAGTVAWGIFLHLAVGVALGILFSASVPKDLTLFQSSVAGAGCALFVMAFTIPLVLPAVAPTLAASLPRHGGACVIAITLFGAVAGVAPALRRRLGAPGRRSRRAAPLRPRTSS